MALSAACKAVWDRTLAEIRARKIGQPTYPVLLILGNDVGPAASEFSVALVGDTFWSEETFRAMMGAMTERVCRRYWPGPGDAAGVEG